MTVRAETPLEQLLASGLHRLAQPVSSAMWALELAKEPNVAPLPQLATEMRRAAGILHAMRSLMEAGTAYPDHRPECINDLIAQIHLEADQALANSGIVCQPLDAVLRIRCNVDARGFAIAYRMLLEKFLMVGAAPAVIRQSLKSTGNGFVLTLECDSAVIGTWSGSQRSQLFQEMDPFEIPGFDFNSNTAPDLTQARAILGAAGILLTGEVDGPAMRFLIQGPQFRH